MVFFFTFSGPAGPPGDQGHGGKFFFFIICTANFAWITSISISIASVRIDSLKTYAQTRKQNRFITTDSRCMI